MSSSEIPRALDSSSSLQKYYKIKKSAKLSFADFFSSARLLRERLRYEQPNEEF